MDVLVQRRLQRMETVPKSTPRVARACRNFVTVRQLPQTPERGGSRILTLKRPQPDGSLPSQNSEPEQRPENAAPLLLYLASSAAAEISGRIFGAYGFKYIRWSEPHHERELTSPGPWQIDELFAQFPRTLGDSLSLEQDLLWPMTSVEQKPADAFNQGPGLDEGR